MPTSPPPRRPADRGADTHPCVSGADDDAQFAAAAREVSAADAPDCRVGAGEFGAALETQGDDNSPFCGAFKRLVEQLGAALWGSSVHVETVTENTEAREGDSL